MPRLLGADRGILQIITRRSVDLPPQTSAMEAPTEPPVPVPRSPEPLHWAGRQVGTPLRHTNTQR